MRHLSYRALLPVVLRVAMAYLSTGLVAPAQMVPVNDPASPSTLAAPGGTEALYVNAPDAAVAAASGSPARGAEPSSGEPAVALPPQSAVRGLPRPVVLPPKPKPVRNLPPPSAEIVRVRPFRAAAFGVNASTLGAGAELAVPLARTLNVRVGASYLNWKYPFQTDGIHYSPGLKFVTGRGTIDWFPHHGAFHISGGALYFRNNIAGGAEVPEGTQFTLGDTTYTNSVDDPVGGHASLQYGTRVAPLLLLGVGNLLPRSGRHISVPFEFGGAYMRPPVLNLKLSGTACTTQGCFNAATDPQVQQNLAAEVVKLQRDIRFLQVYPIVSLGIACRF